MFGIRIMLEKDFQRELENARENVIDFQIAELEFEKNMLQTQVNNYRNQKNDFAKAQSKFYEQRRTLTQSMKNEAELRQALREIVEKFNLETPAVSIKNEELIKEINAIFAIQNKTIQFQFSLLNEMAEKGDIGTISKIQDYVKTMSHE